MRVAVTGAGGFVGPYLLEELRQAGAEVLSLDRALPRRPLPEGCEHQKVDLLDRAAVLRHLEAFAPEAVLHLAGWSHVGRSWQHPAETFEANVVASIRLYEAAASLEGTVKKFLYVSSADVYGGAHRRMPLDEDSPTNPESPYAASKLAAETTLRLLRKRLNVPLVIARPFNHVGPGQDPSFVCPAFAWQVAEVAAGRRPVLRHGNLSALRDFLDVRDVVRAYRLLLEKGNDGDLFVIASGASRTIESVARDLFRAAGIPPAMEADPALFRPIDTPELRGNPARLRERTGWAQAYRWEDTLTALFKEARDRLAEAVTAEKPPTP